MIATTTTTRTRLRTGTGTHGGGAVAAEARKNDLALVVATVVAFAVVVASLLLLVYVRTAQIGVGYRVHDLGTEMVKLDREHAALEVERATLLRPTRLAALAKTTLGLVPVDAQHLLDVNAAPAPAPEVTP